MSPVLELLLPSCLLSVYLLHKIIYIAHKAELYDHPDEHRKIHLDSTPSLGGAAIFVCLLLFASLCSTMWSLPHFNILALSLCTLFLTGITDDLVGMNPYKKFAIQLFAASLVVIGTDYHITSLHGFLGIGQLDDLTSRLLTIVFILATVNAFNLIDGINCLASGLALTGLIVYAFLFDRINDSGSRDLCLVLIGSLVAFIYYNRTPAKIFLGDSGSLMLGFLIAIFSIRLLQEASAVPGMPLDGTLNIPAIVAGILTVPYFDTIRVFLLRTWKRKSPFAADRNHLHHLLLDSGFNHLQASGVLIAVSLVMISIALSGSFIRLDAYILIQALSLGIPVLLISQKRKRAKQNDIKIGYPMTGAIRGGKLKVIGDRPIAGNFTTPGQGGKV